MGAPVLRRGFFDRPSEQVAPDLLGCTLQVRGGSGTVVVRISEVEAYAGADDPASHAFRGRTPRTAVMFGPPGHLYCYFTYGMHHCLNVVCGPDGTASAVLLRAGEVTEGVDLARQRRPAARRDIALASGPARLAQAVGLTTADNGLDLCGRASPVRLVARDLTPTSIATGPRVGVSQAADVPLRFWIDGDASVSAYKRSPRAPAR